MPVLLLLLFSLALSTGAAMVMLVVHLVKARGVKDSKSLGDAADNIIAAQTNFSNRPGCWLAIKSQDLNAVQTALGLHCPRPGSWIEALEHKLCVLPPVKGWVLVVGSDLPDPGDDVDRCYRFLLDLSRKLGQVQYFKADPLLSHHAWVRADKGRIVRAYAWAGHTVWHEGIKTVSELELSLKCFAYTEFIEDLDFGQSEVLARNVDKVPSLAARWSLDPAELEERMECWNDGKLE